MHDDAQYCKVFDRRHVGFLRAQVSDLTDIVDTEKSANATLQKSFQRLTYANNFMLVAFMSATLFAL